MQAGCDAAILIERSIPHQAAITEDAVPLGTPPKGWGARRAIPAGKQQTVDSAHPVCLGALICDIRENVHVALHISHLQSRGKI